jgi:lysophospholipid acyltransferase (LPLAT)-like uncharacterized protein
LAIWHQNLLGGILAQTGKHYIVIVSRSADAEPVAYACSRFGHLVVRGSSRKGQVDKGGQAAKAEMIEELKRGVPGAVTVDGPKGPAFKVKQGIIQMAKESDSYIVPYTVKAQHYKQFQSWDRFQLPLPFSKILVHYGGPIDVSTLDEESSCALVENVLNQDSLKISELAVNL